MKDEADFSWTQLDYPWERLRWAREKVARLSQRAAARALEMDETGYGHHERDPAKSRNTELTIEKAMAFGQIFNVRWEWLYHGTGEPWSAPAPEPKLSSEAKSVAELIDKTPEEERPAVVEAIKTLLRRAG